MQRGDQIPHFDVAGRDGRRLRYSDTWQRRHLLLVCLPAGPDADAYAARLAARAAEISALDSDIVVTSDSVAGVPCPAVVIADRWGEVAEVCAPVAMSELPSVRDILEWLTFLQHKCPECEGEAR